MIGEIVGFGTFQSVCLIDSTLGLHARHIVHMSILTRVFLLALQVQRFEFKFQNIDLIKNVKFMVSQ